MPNVPHENGTSEIVKKMLQKKKGDSKDHDEVLSDNQTEQQSMPTNEPVPMTVNYVDQSGKLKIDLVIIII